MRQKWQVRQDSNLQFQFQLLPSGFEDRGDYVPINYKQIKFGRCRRNRTDTKSFGDFHAKPLNIRHL